MKIFLYKVFLFLGLITAGLFLLYATFDHHEETIGDYRYGKVRRIFRTSNNYNTLLIGSSRVINIRDTVIGEDRIYNFGMIGGMPREYPQFIKFGIATKPIRKVIVGLDFYGTSRNGLEGINDLSVVLRKPEEYISDVESETAITSFFSRFEFPRFKRLVNSILFEQALAKGSESGEKVWVKKHWPIYVNAYANYEVNPEIEEIYKEIKQEGEKGGTELKVFITPISKPLFELLLQNNLAEEYENFLRLAVKTYGTVYNFMEINEFTSLPANFIDENHTTNDRLFETIKFMTTGEQAPTIKATKLTPDVIEDYISNKRYLQR